ncbi:fibronectin type III domain-containing protein [Marinicella sp. W31]|uniref:fibronectin type III domain-containing protein n=1 Tax=Marinicella sp. W31 TaxID=3023713 RepID=UPI0037574DC6
MKHISSILHLHKPASWLLILLFIAPAAIANIGGINMNSVTENSINISWHYPSSDYQASGGGSPEDYKICYKKVGTFGLICSASTAYSATTNYVITGLDPSTTYKIKVKCHCKRKTWGGKWRYPRWRTVAEIQVTTDAATPDPIESNLIATETYSDLIKVKASHADMLAFTGVRICYRRKWVTSAYEYASRCSHHNPADFWLGSDANLGWVDIIPNTSPHWVDTSDMSVSILLNPPIDLKSCKKYIILGFGKDSFTVSNAHLITIGSVETETSGPCGLFKMATVIVSDYEDTVLQHYSHAIDRFYGQPLLDVLAQTYDQELYGNHELFLREEGEDISNTHTMLRYLIESDSPLYDRWQNDQNMITQDLTLDTFVRQHYAEIHTEVQSMQPRN